jgi:ABC-type antimicrobial peptide transport system permease subunit
VPLRLETINDRIRESLVRERVMAWIATALGLAALALACAGLYGLLAYAVSRQVKEIGLRLALGATRGDVLLGVLRDCAMIAGIGIIIGAATSLALGRYVRSLLFQVSPSDLLSLSIAAAVMLVLAAAAGVLPARRAATIDPSAALRD